MKQASYLYNEKLYAEKYHEIISALEEDYSEELA